MAQLFAVSVMSIVLPLPFVSGLTNAVRAPQPVRSLRPYVPVRRPPVSGLNVPADVRFATEADFVHNGGDNVVFFDGHAKWLNFSTLRG